MGKTIVIAENKMLFDQTIRKPLLEHLNCNTLLIDELNQSIGDYYIKALMRLDALIIKRLVHSGYDVSDVKAIAERCTIVTMSGSKEFELWIDRGKISGMRICKYTDPVISTNCIKFKFDV